MVLFWRLPLPLLLVWSGASAVSVTCPFGGSLGKQCLLDISQDTMTKLRCGGSDVCVKEDGNNGFCCPVPDDVRCHGDQLPYYKKGGKCEDLSVPHPTKSGVCCQIFISEMYREDTKPAVVRAVNQNTACTLDNDCGKDQFCGDAVLNLMRQETQGNPKRCFHEQLTIPPMVRSDQNAALVCLGDHSCSPYTDPKDGLHVTGCTGAYSQDGHYCHHRQCLFGIAPRSHQQKCSANKDCDKNELCVEVLPGIEHHCCPVADKFKCHGDQLPDFEEGRLQCPPGMLNHPSRSEETCCQPFIYANWRESFEVQPVRQDVRCEKSSECLIHEFCGLSTLRNTHDQLIGTPKHCYKRPMFGTASAMLTNEDDIVVCHHGEPCTTKLLSSCKWAQVALLNICYESNCPLWNRKNAIDSSKYGSACTSTSKCQADAHCVSLFGDEKRCCPIDTKMLCPGGVLPVLDGFDQAVKTCDVTKHFVHSAEGRTFCCDKPHSKDFEGQGLISPKEDSKPCNKNKDCPWDYFCGVSVIDGARKVVDGYAITDPIRHCYSRPSFGSVRAMTKKENQGLEDCAKAEDCRTNNPAICEKGTVDGKTTRKICFEKQCPFNAPLTSKSTCSAQSSCKAGQMCVNVIGSVKHCCPVPDDFKCHTTQLPYKPGSTECKDGSKAHTKQTGFCCQDYIYKGLGDSTPVAPVRPEECVDENQCAKGEFCGASTLSKMGEYLQGSPRHCYKRPVLGDGKAYLDQGELILCDKVENCKGDHIRSCKKFPAYNKKICFRAYCPLWPKENPLDRSKFAKVCQDDSSCPGAFCVTLTGIDKHCCPIDPKLTCPGGVLPVMEAGNKPLTACDASKHFVHSVGGLKLCCDKPHSKDFEALGEISPKELFKPCKKDKDCDSGYFCGVSVINGARMDVQGYAITDPIRHCYKRPSFQNRWAMIRLENQGLEDCAKAEDCRTNNPAICEKGTVDGKTTRKICFEKQCPFNAPLTSKSTCSAQSSCKAGQMCVNVIGSVKHCCPVPDDFKCHTTQLPYKPGSTECKDGSKAHTKQTGFCCQDYIYKGTGDSSPVAPVRPEECTKESECGKGEFCGASTVAKMGEYLQGSPKHCYKRPVRGDGKASLVNGDLVFCTADTDCPGTLIKSCKPDSNYKPSICFESNCPLWLENNPIDSSKYSQLCYNKPSVCSSGSHCVSLLTNEKRCCPVEPTFMCPGANLPVLGGDDKPLTTCDSTIHFVHTAGQTKLCCDMPIAKYLHNASGETVLSKNERVPCSTNAQCGGGYFCAESLTKGSKKAFKVKVMHCYKQPVDGELIPGNGQSGLVICEKHEGCDMAKGQFCYNKFAHLKKGLCYKATCPLGGLPSGKFQACSKKSECGDNHCHPVHDKKYSGCCTVDTGNLCPGGIPPIELWKTECKGTNVFSRNINNIPVCCLHVVSKKIKSTGTLWRLTEKESDDIPAMDAKLCKTSGPVCPAGFFCDESVPLEGDSLGVAVKHCYPVPKTHGTSVAGPPAQLTTCTDSKKCTGGQICDNKISLLDSRIKNAAGVCSVFQCPLSTSHISRPSSFSKGINLCSTSANCESGRHCHPVGSGQHYKGCCDIAPEFLCPARIPPTELWNSECKGENIFSRVLNNVPACCLRVVSKKMKATDNLWHLAEKESEEIAAMELRVCKTSGDVCDAGFFCDESVSMEGSDLGVKHCYPVPTTHGVSVVGPPAELKTCTDSKECTRGQICDNKISLLDSRIKNTAGVCSIFKCPLSTSDISRPPSFSEGIDLCSSATACESGKACHPIGSGELYKACCDVADEYLCPGGLFPTKVQKKMYYTEGDIECDAGTFKYKWGTGDTPADGARCCPKVVSLDFLVEPVRSDETCQKNSDCKDDEFCGTSTLEENLSNPKTLEVNGVRVHHCYKSPKCSGTIILKPNIGLKTCTKEYNSCETDQICDLDLGATNQGRFAGASGVCCHFQCSGSVPEGKAGDVGKPGKACNCKGETKAQAFCDEDLQNDENTINVCEATGVEGTYRQCTYAREALKCFGEYEGPLRRKGSFEVVPCSNHVVCQGASKEFDGGASLCTSPLNPSTIPKICCKADLCPDHFTFRGNQDTCTNDGDCSKTEGTQQLKAKCQGDILGKSTAKHCCPFTDNMGRIEVVYPFDTKTHCTSLGDCLGDNRFCDLAKSTCIYNWRAADERKKSGTCTKDQMVCGGDKRVVCMTSELADTTSEPECFRHPFDECEKNKHCPSVGLVAGFCAPAVGTSATDYAKAFRRCHTVPLGAAFLQLGLKECKDAADCTMDQSCIKGPTVATTPGFGYCKRNFEMTCHGSTQIDDSNGEVFTCSKNIDCGENGFCDMDITRPRSIPQDKGICCSRPICGGDLVLKEAGVKVCTDDTGCSTKGGEICIKDIEKPENSAWKAGEGVCCKGTCPNIQHPEASVDVVPAGPICAANNCQNTTDTIRMCVGGTNVTFQRCCSYPRKTNICPADFNGPVRNGFDAKPCATTKDCPAASECSGGFCCKQTFCSDKKTVKTAQLKCSKKSAEKDCRQPSGAVATCEKGRCCPKTHESKILEPFVTTTRCRRARDCPFNKMFCETSTRNCTYFGNNLKALETDKNCERGNLTCVGRDNLMGVCLYPDDNRNNLPSCYLNPMSESRIQENTEDDVDESAMVLGSILGIVAMALATVGLGGTLLASYYKISKKNVRDKMRKAEKALNKYRKKKKPKKEELTGQSELWKNETSQSKVEQSQSQVDQSQMSQVETRASKKSGKSVKE